MSLLASSFEIIIHSSGLSHIAVNLSLVVEVFDSVGKIILRFLPTFVKNSLFLPLKLIFITGEISFTEILSCLISFLITEL